VPPAPAASLAAAGSMAPIAMPSRRRGFPWAVLLVLGLLAVLAVGGATGVFFWMRGKGIGPFAQPATTAALDATSGLGDGSGTAPSGAESAGPFDKSGVPSSSTGATNGTTQTGATETAAAYEAVPEPQPSVPVAAATAPPRPTAPPAAPPPQVASREPSRSLAPASQPSGRDTAPSRSEPASAYPPARSQPVAEQPPPSRSEPARSAYADETPAPPAAPPAAAAERFDHEMTTGLSLKFSVPSPDDVFLGIKQDGDRRFTSIGKAADFDAEKKKLPGYDLPGPGIYYLRLVSEGRELVYRLDARSGPPTVITASIGPPKQRRRG
jgi:hypothetical protein